MNNINTVENARAVVTDANVTNTGGPQGSAKPEAEGGKVLPSTVRSEATVQEKPPVDVAEQRSVRVEKAVEKLNDYVQSIQRDLRFSMDEDLGRTVVRVVDSNTQEVIRQIPNETALQLARNLKEIRDVEMQNELRGLSPASSSAENSLGLINTRI